MTESKQTNVICEVIMKLNILKENAAHQKDEIIQLRGNQ